MAVETVEAVDLTQITNRNAVQFIGELEDGRESHFGVDVFAVEDDFAYGSVLATTQTRPEQKLFEINSELSRRYARLPLRGILTPGEIVVEISKTEDPGWPHEGYAQAEYEEFPLVAKGLRLHTRSEE